MSGVWLYTMSLNEERMLPFFFRHYDGWIDRYIVYDDGSTDGTLAMLAAHPRVEIRRFQRVVQGSFVSSATVLQNTVWKELRGQADWVVITAIDEHLYHPDIVGYLARCRAAGVTALPALGFQMLADGFPAGSPYLAETLRIGAPYVQMNKLSLFDPNRLAETNYGLGRHAAAPTGNVVYPAADEVLNLHYKYLGLDYVRARHRMLVHGLGEYDRSLGLGAQYAWSPEELEADWRRFAGLAIDYRDRIPAMHPFRWWRPDATATGPA